MSGLLQDDELLYVGTYAAAEAPGIFACSFDAATGKLREVAGFAGIDKPSYLAPDRRNGKLYAVSETDTYNGNPGGSMAVYDVAAGSGRLEKLQQLPTHGGWPCYVSVGEAGDALYVADYKDGKLTVFPLDAEGRAQPGGVQVIEHAGSGPNKARQEGPHAHSIVPLPGSPYVVSCDLGIDKVIVYKVDPASRHLLAHSEALLPPGTGPRHPVFSAGARFLYITGELDSTVTVCAVERESGMLRPVQTISMLPADFTGDSTAADLHLSPDGKFLYASNRGHDSIAIFRVDPASGQLEAAGHSPSGGKTPRNFAISPNGKFVLAANQDSNNIAIFARDAETGQLQPTGNGLELFKPVCIRFV
jgi:6-phosphogluconolactonase